MRKIKLIVLAFLVTNALLAQVDPPEPTQVVKPLLHKGSATWCGPCGEFGMTFGKTMKNGNVPKAFYLNLQAGGSDLSTSTTDALGVLSSGGGIPSWYVNGFECDGQFTNQMEAKAKKLVDSFALTTPIAASTYTFTLTGRTLSVKSKTKFFSQVLATQGEYTMGLYLVEDSVINRQNTSSSGYVANVVHDDLLRTTIIAGKNWGDVVSDNPVTSSGTIKSKTYSFDIPTTYRLEKLRLLQIIARKSGTKYTVINAYYIGEYLKPSTVGPPVFTLNCSSITSSGTLTATKPATAGVGFSVPYVNAKVGDPISATNSTSTGVTGLTAKLTAGTFAASGDLNFVVTGTPSAAGDANFSFTVAGKQCSYKMTVLAANLGVGDSFNYKMVLPGTAKDTSHDVSGNFTLVKDQVYTWKIESIANLLPTWKLVTVCDNFLCYNYPTVTNKDFTAKGVFAEDYIKLGILHNKKPGYGFAEASITKKGSTLPTDTKKYKFSLLVTATGSVNLISDAAEKLLYYFDNRIFIDKDLIGSDVQVFDMKGQQLMSSKVNSDNIDFNPSTNGIYIAIVSKDGQVLKTHKFTTSK